jgi:3D-(3,5/4)-trihydroxycyclohexane-1,2-dione acylhydrolase (decyclizing)
MTTIRLTMAQALVRFLAAQRSELDGREVPLFAGVFAIFGHGNVAGLGEALYGARERLPTLRAHNEQAMGLAAVAFAKGEPAASHDGLHEFDRPGRNEHGDRSSGRARQSPAAAALARRRLREPASRSRIAAGRGFRRPDDLGQ